MSINPSAFALVKDRANKAEKKRIKNKKVKEIMEDNPNLGSMEAEKIVEELTEKELKKVGEDYKKRVTKADKEARKKLGLSFKENNKEEKKKEEKKKEENNNKKFTKKKNNKKENNKKENNKPIKEIVITASKPKPRRKFKRTMSGFRPVAERQSKGGSILKTLKKIGKRQRG